MGTLALLAASLVSMLVMPSAMLASASSVVGTISSLSQARSITVDPAGTFAYVVEESGALSKVNLSDDSIVSRLSGFGSGWDVAINPAGTFAYFIVNNAIKKIDLSNFTVSTTITVSRSYNIAINPAGTFAYVTQGSVLSKIDLSTNVVTTVPNISGSSIFDIAIDSAGAYAYVTDVSLSRMSKIDLTTNTVVHISIPGLEPNGVAINPAGTFAYVSHYSDSLQLGVLSKIDTSSGSIVASVPVGQGYMGAVVINSGGTLAFVADNSGGTVAKVNLMNYRKAASFTVGNSPWGIALNPAGTIAYVANTTSGTVSKIAVTRTEAQTISFTTVGKSVVPAPLTQLLGTKTAVVSASATSSLPVTFSSGTTSICTVSGDTVTFVSNGDCTINANQAGDADWDAATQVSRTFAILPSPPSGEPGVSINGGASYTNSKSVTLNLVWPEFATEVRISNDGGFSASATSTVPLASTVKWDLDDSVKGIYTKVVYVRFSGVGDQSKSYTDDIILDTNAPAVETPSASATLGSIEISLRATDDISGVDKVEVKNGTNTVVKGYESKFSVTEKELGLTVSTASVRKSESSSIEIRVSDKAGNWSAYQTLAVYRAGLTTVNTRTAVLPKVTLTKTATAKSIATYAKLSVLSTSKVSLQVVASSAKSCKVTGTTLKGLKAGTCKVTVTVTPKKGRATSKTVTLKVTK
jgi:DNA-binding beta-propeller fold protein YncE